jgi:hypothetical protein
MRTAIAAVKIVSISPDWQLAGRVRNATLDGDQRVDRQHQQVKGALRGGDGRNDVSPDWAAKL